MPEQLSFLKENHFNHTHVKPWREIPLTDELFVADWEEYIKDIPRLGALAVLQKKLVQLNFPVEAGMSKNSDYQLATRRGMDALSMPGATGVELEEPDHLEVYLCRTIAGRIPVIQVGNRNDFEALVRVFLYKNEPVSIPPSMGACMIKGYNNWARVKKYKEKWHSDNGYEENMDFLWELEFAKMKSQPELYRDTFIILSDMEYSNVPAGMLGIAGDEWRRLSLVIRREHEATHYCTLRFFGSARDHLLDELIADYMGIVAAVGRYIAHWFLCFMGLENYPAFRSGGRLVNYLKNKELSGAAFEALKSYIKNAAQNLETYSEKYVPGVYQGEGKYRMLLAMSKMNLIELASEGIKEKLL
ncbi:hypothetical protein L9W92_00680 [Pelotomaculum terephthalicicum JT]|uniref:DUF7005 family protein n=1 Tax=Pelotomaculum TaxID=191373 RepID=UPI0009CEFDE3|nr:MULTISPECIES: hypothetical protein [Pelotomaculum]MCG9966572.1 hypothetical protein [Pelotomaculum terephthalicicum JT]OPX92342.1 MAG: hypothetical protein A4E54_00022 [Pelotomaculum sp. PtaB.Bin117]OPY63510.1 MAG: hypothetical protein A4E56_00503 [Pelotomaculum sp. PtaU1.Bin065]